MLKILKFKFFYFCVLDDKGAVQTKMFGISQLNCKLEVFVSHKKYNKKYSSS